MYVSKYSDASQYRTSRDQHISSVIGAAARPRLPLRLQHRPRRFLLGLLRFLPADAVSAGVGGNHNIVQNRKKHRQNSHLIIHCPTSEGVSKANEWAQRSARVKRVVRSERTSERCERTSERVSGASERANGRASGPVLQSVFLIVLAHSAPSASSASSSRCWRSRFPRRSTNLCPNPWPK